MKILVALSLVILAGCVQARDPQLIAIKQAEDSGLGCEQIAIEYRTNTEVARRAKLPRTIPTIAGNYFSES